MLPASFACSQVCGESLVWHNLEGLRIWLRWGAYAWHITSAILLSLRWHALLRSHPETVTVCCYTDGCRMEVACAKGREDGREGSAGDGCNPMGQAIGLTSTQMDG